MKQYALGSPTFAVAELSEKRLGKLHVPAVVVKLSLALPHSLVYRSLHEALTPISKVVRVV